ncbi:MAG TPA: glycosyltransferase family 39 protein [Candidatus Wallbacteria bacterium]|nr:glycosyltransferase family 39 protein [Candidatus Wallbacteria bacterium]
MIRYLFKAKKLHILLIFLAFGLFSARLYDGTLRTYDECYYAQQAREIILTGDWLTMHHALLKNFENDPVYLWSMAVSFKLFGFSEFAARIPSALYGTLTAATVFLTGKLLKNYLFGIVSALILTTTWEFIRFARYAHLDVCLAFFSALAAYNFLKYEKMRLDSPEKYRAEGLKNSILMGICAGLAMLSKNLLGTFPLICVVIYYLAIFNIRAIFNLRLIAGFITAAVLPGTWYAYQYFTNGVDFFKVHFGYIIFQRAFNNAVEAAPAYQYFKIIALTYIPWLILLIPGIYLIARKSYAISVKKEAVKNFSRLFLFELIFCAVLLAVMSVSSAKKGWYIMSIYPAFAIISAYGLSAFKRFGNRASVMRFAEGTIIFIFLCVFLISVLPIKLYNSTNDEFKKDFKAFAEINPELKMKRNAIRAVEISDDYFDYQLPMLFYSSLIPEQSIKYNDFKKTAGTDKKMYYLFDARKFEELKKETAENGLKSFEISLKTANFVLGRMR